MGQVVAILWSAGPTPVDTLALIRAAEAAGWTTRVHDKRSWIGVSGPRPATVQILDAGRTVVVGDMFPATHPLASLDDGSDLVRATRLVQCCWGRYIALFRAGDDAFTSVLRDPSGALDCAIWRDGRSTIVATCLPSWLTDSGRKRWTPDLERVADILADPTLISGPIALEGVTSVAPGEWQAFSGEAKAIWRPGAVAQADPRSSEVRDTRLRATIDVVVEALTRDAHVLAEVSGGLDSAIVASTRHAIASDGRTSWVNTWGPYAEADERSYAQAITDRICVRLTSVERRKPSGSMGLCLAHPSALRPSVNRMDAAYDHDQAEQCASLGLDTILTGKGGDVAFFQTATTAIFADLLIDRGLVALADPCLAVLSRRLRRSAWSVLWRASTASRRVDRHGGSGRPPLGLIHADVGHRRPTPHPWLDDLTGLPPGKRQQITGFAGNLALHGLSERTEAADLIHPLLSQPVMEFCLQTPSYVLTGGGHDRLLARQAFSERLPPEIINRRSKGELGVYYGQAIAAGLDDLKPHLLEGRLAAARLIDREQVEAALSAEHLIWQGGYGDIMLLALIESWLRSWD